MAFIKNDFAKLSSSLNNITPRMWGYFTPTDSLFAVQFGAGYFNDISDEVTVGDLVHVNATDGARLYQFSDITSGVVTVGNATRNTTESFTLVTTVGAAQEEHPLNIIQTGVIRRAFLFVGFGITSTGNYVFELHDQAAGLIGTATVGNGASQGDPFFVDPSPVFPIGQFQTMFWRKLGGSPAASITLNSHIIIEVSE